MARASSLHVALRQWSRGFIPGFDTDSDSGGPRSPRSARARPPSDPINASPCLAFRQLIFTTNANLQQINSFRFYLARVDAPFHPDMIFFHRESLRDFTRVCTRIVFQSPKPGQQLSSLFFHKNVPPIPREPQEPYNYTGAMAHFRMELRFLCEGSDVCDLSAAAHLNKFCAVDAVWMNESIRLEIRCALRTAAS